MTVLANARVVAADGVLDPGDVHAAEGRITDVVPAGSARPVPTVGERIDLQGRWLLPGFVDLHVHGGGGASFTVGDPDSAREAAAFHLANGTTSMLASLVTAAVDDLADGAAVLADLVDDGTLVGVHLEGPFLSPVRCGAQSPQHLRPPDVAVLRRLVRASRETVRMVTVAPELPGALDLVRVAGDLGAVPAAGHTDASYDETVAAIDAGVRVATHLFNGMRPLHHRDPGPVTALLERPEVVVELINDGVHLHPAVVRLVHQTVGFGRVAFVTDAIAAAGMGDGEYELGPMRVRVRDGVARLVAGGSIAGSTLTMAEAVRGAALAGLPVTDVAVAAATTPAAVLGLTGRTGVLAPGADADVVVLDDGFGLVAVMHRGGWVGEAP